MLLRRNMSEEQPLYQIHYAMHGSSMYKRRLYDIEGKLLRDSNGIPLTIYHPQFKELLDSQKIRIIHCIHPGYRYFIQSEAQLNRFHEERKHGSVIPNRYYHIYNDEDMTEHPNRRKRTYYLLPKA